MGRKPPSGAHICRFTQAEIFVHAEVVPSTEPRSTTPARYCKTCSRKGRTIIGVCAAGILIRLLAPVLNSKRDEPPVLAVSEDGAVVVPLLGGHRGGNRLADELAETLGGQSAITTASDRRFGVALDDPPSGWVLSNPADANAFLARLLDGAAVQLHGTADWMNANSDLPLSESGDLIIEVAETPTEAARTISCITSATWQLALVASAIHRPMK